MFVRLAVCALFVVALANAATSAQLSGTWVGTCNINVFQLPNNGAFVCSNTPVVQDYEVTFVTNAAGALTGYTSKSVNPVTQIINGQVATAAASTQTYTVISNNGDQLTVKNGVLANQCETETVSFNVPAGFQGQVGYGIQTLVETNTVALGTPAAGGGVYGGACADPSIVGPSCAGGKAQYQCTLQRKLTTVPTVYGSNSVGQPFSLAQLNGQYVGTCAVNVLADLTNPSQFICVSTPVNQQIYLSYANGQYTYTSGPQSIQTINGKLYTPLQAQQSYKINSLNGNQLRLQGNTKEECYGEYLSTDITPACQANPNTFNCLYPQRITEVNVVSLVDGSYGASCPTISQVGCTANTATYICNYVRVESLAQTPAGPVFFNSATTNSAVASVLASVFAVVALLF